MTVFSSWTLQRDESNRPVLIIVLNHDITASKKAEDELKKSGERLDAIFEQFSRWDHCLLTPFGMTHGVLRDLRFAMINAAAERLMGLNASDLLGHTVLEKFPTLRHGWSVYKIYPDHRRKRNSRLRAPVAGKRSFPAGIAWQV